MRRRGTQSLIAAAGELGHGGGAQHGRVGATAGPQLLLEDGLVDEHAEPVDGPAARARRGAQERRLERVVHEVGDDLARDAAAAGSNGTSLVAHADRRGVDDDVRAAPTSSTAPTRAAGASAAAATARSAVRLTTAMSAAPARPSASTTLRAAAPAPSDDHAPALDGDAGGGQRGDESVAVGAVADQRGRRHRTTVLTDRNAAAAGASSSTAAATSALCGVVTDSPTEPERAHRVDGSRAAIRPATSKAT